MTQSPDAPGHPVAPPEDACARCGDLSGRLETMRTGRSYCPACLERLQRPLVLQALRGETDLRDRMGWRVILFFAATATLLLTLGLLALQLLPSALVPRVGSLGDLGLWMGGFLLASLTAVILTDLMYYRYWLEGPWLRARNGRDQQVRLDALVSLEEHRGARALLHAATVRDARGGRVLFYPLQRHLDCWLELTAFLCPRAAARAGAPRESAPRVDDIHWNQG